MLKWMKVSKTVQLAQILSGCWYLFDLDHLIVLPQCLSLFDEVIIINYDTLSQSVLIRCVQKRILDKELPYQTVFGVVVVYCATMFARSTYGDIFCSSFQLHCFQQEPYRIEVDFDQRRLDSIQTTQHTFLWTLASSCPTKVSITKM